MKGVTFGRKIVFKTRQSPIDFMSPDVKLLSSSFTSSWQGILGAGGAIYSLHIPNMTEAGLNTFLLTILSQKDSNTYATDLYAVNHSLKSIATAWKDVSVQVYTNNKSVFQSIQKPRQQSGQELLREIYETTQILYENRCSCRSMRLFIDYIH